MCVSVNGTCAFFCSFPALDEALQPSWPALSSARGMAIYIPFSIKVDHKHGSKMCLCLGSLNMRTPQADPLTQI